jgi:CRISPR/Cas system-associated protein endoribonuclease Cas2
MFSLVSFVKGLFVNKELEALKSQLASTAAELERVNELRTIRVDNTKQTAIEKDLKSASQFITMSWSDLNRYHSEVVQTWLEDIQASVIALGYKEIPNILKEYRTEMIQHFVLTQKVALGEYAPELDNLDSLTREMLIDTACQLNQIGYEKRMTEQGKAGVTDKQKEMLSKNGITVIPRNRFEASRLIDEALRAKGVDTSKAYSSDATTAQLNRIKTMAEMLSVEANAVKTKSEASKEINRLQEELDKRPELIPSITQKQFDTIVKLLKQLNKRMTKKREEEYKKLNTVQASKLISDLSREYNEAHPEATKGQVQYIITLCNILNLPYSIDDIKALTRVQATEKLDKLNRQYLYVLTRKTNPGMTKDDIANMSYDAVKALIAQIKEENKSRDYKDFPQERA